MNKLQTIDGVISAIFENGNTINANSIKFIADTANTLDVNNANKALEVVQKAKNVLELSTMQNSLNELLNYLRKSRRALQAQNDYNKVNELILTNNELLKQDTITLPVVIADLIKNSIKDNDTKIYNIFQEYSGTNTKEQNQQITSDKNHLDKLKDLAPKIETFDNVIDLFKQGYKPTTIAKYLGYEKPETNRDMVISFIAIKINCNKVNLLNASIEFFPPKQISK